MHSGTYSHLGTPVIYGLSSLVSWFFLSLLDHSHKYANMCWYCPPFNKITQKRPITNRKKKFFFDPMWPLLYAWSLLPHHLFSPQLPEMGLPSQQSTKSILVCHEQSPCCQIKVCLFSFSLQPATFSPVNHHHFLLEILFFSQLFNKQFSCYSFYLTSSSSE